MPDTSKPEYRKLDVAELRAEGEGSDRKITGYAAVFNKDSLDLGGFIERIKPGAFAGVLAADHDIRALVDHEPSKILGRSTAGTLSLVENKKGLKVTITPPDTQLARDLAVSIDRGDIDQMSFAFRVAEDGQEWKFSNDPEKLDRRTITAFAEVRDVSVVTYGAFPDTSVDMRSYEEARSAHEADDAKPVPTPNKDAARVELARRRAEK